LHEKISYYGWKAIFFRFLLKGTAYHFTAILPQRSSSQPGLLFLQPSFIDQLREPGVRFAYAPLRRLIWGGSPVRIAEASAEPREEKLDTRHGNGWKMYGFEPVK